MNSKKYLISCISGIAVILLVVSAVVWYVDPYFQYHVPREGMAYEMKMNSFSYYNAGIAKNFSYNTIITGSSMSRAMSPSYIDEKFNCKTVKLSMAEARGKDFQILFSLFKKNPNLKKVIMGLDTFAFYVDKDYSSYEKPMHLYDENLLNDVLYLTNMDGLVESLRVFTNTKSGATTTTMDDYQNYTLTNTFSRDNVLEIYNGNEATVQDKDVDKNNLKKTVLNNLEQNVIPTIEQNSEVDFLFYFPPYSIAKWGMTQNRATEIECMRIIMERLIPYPNVSIYFYQGEKEVITDLDHYMDSIHFDSIVANKIIDYMVDERNKLTNENYMQVMNEFDEFIQNYNYSSIQ